MAHDVREGATHLGDDPQPIGAKAVRNQMAANDFTIARSIWNMHDALLAEQARTNQLLLWIGELLTNQIKKD